MNFDQARREFKKTLWGEELDNERYSNPVASSVELESLQQYQGKKQQCKNCGQEFEGKLLFHTKLGNYCSKCYRICIKVNEQ